MKNKEVEIYVGNNINLASKDNIVKASISNQELHAYLFFCFLVSGLLLVLVILKTH